MADSFCKGCGKKIIWAKTTDGKTVPLDPVPPTWELHSHDEKGNAIWKRCSAMVSHFITCPDRDEFSVSRKQGSLGL